MFKIPVNNTLGVKVLSKVEIENEVFLIPSRGTEEFILQTDWHAEKWPNINQDPVPAKFIRITSLNTSEKIVLEAKAKVNVIRKIKINEKDQRTKEDGTKIS